MNRSRIAFLGLVLAATGCASDAAAPSPASKAPPAPAFELAGWRVIGCCCAPPCPCRINKKPDFCHGCDHTDAVHIDRGHVGRTRMDGLTWVVVGRAFAEKAELNWAVVYLSDRATPEQEKALGDMLTADVKAWGPKAKYLAGDFKGIKRVPMKVEVSTDRREYAIAIADILDLRVRALVVPGHRNPAVSTGILDAFGDRLVHADCLSHRYKDAALNYEWDLTGRQSNYAEFTLTPERAAKGGIGWGCWTGNVEFGDTGQYREQITDHDRKK